MSDSSSSWISQNKGFLFLMLALLLGGGVVNYWLPKMATDKRTGAWKEFAEAQQNVREAQSVADYHALLQKNRDNAQIFPWIVAMLANHAASTENTEAMDMLHGELASLSTNNALSGISLQKNGQTIPLINTIENILASEKDRGEFRPSQAKPSENLTLKISLKSSSEMTYDLLFNLYESPALALAALKNLASDGASWQNAELSAPGAQVLQISLPESELQETVPLERNWGEFHAKGALCLNTSSDPASGRQNPGNLLVLNEDSFHLDGRTTVLGMLKSGQADLEALLAAGTNPETGRLAEEVRVTEFEISLSPSE